MMSPLRLDRRSAASTALVVAALAVALGATTAVLGIVDALLLRAVPFPRPAELMQVTTGFPNIRLAGMGLSGPEARELRELSNAFAAVGPLAFASVNVQGGTQAEPINALLVSQGALDALALPPAAGRVFAAEEYDSGSRPVAIISDGYRARAFGGATDVLGRAIRVDGVSRLIVGVAPAGTSLLNRQIDIWIPLARTATDASARADHRYTVIGRLAAGITQAAAMEDLRHAMSIWQVETGELHAPTTRMHPLDLRSLEAATTGLTREPIGALVLAVVLLLALACANVANLMLARADQRRGEVAIRITLGATRARLLKESVAEGVALAAVAALGGLGIARALIQSAVSLWPVAGTASPSIDYRVLGMTALLAVATGIVIGVAPLLRLDVSRAREWLQSTSRSSAGSGRQGLQQTLVAGQIALAVLLSVAAGLMVRSLMSLASVDTGLRTERVTRALVTITDTDYRTDTDVWAFYDRVLTRVRALPGVVDAAIMSGLPPVRRANNTSFVIDGQTVIDHTSLKQVEFLQYVSPGYAAVAGIPLIDGRHFAETDHERGAPVAMVNHTLAERWWPGQSAIGRQIRPVANGPWFTVIGVLRDVRQAGLHEAAGGEVYVTHRQGRLLLSGFLPRSMNLAIKTEDDGSAAAGVLAATIRGSDPAAAISDIAPLQAVIDRSLAQPRLLAWAFTAFGAVSLFVAAIGVYSVTAFAALARIREFGVRTALGARSRDIITLVMRTGLGPVVAGLAAGVIGSLWTTQSLRNLLFGVAPIDMASLFLASAVIVAAAGVAVLRPALVAAGRDPVRSLTD